MQYKYSQRPTGSTLNTHLNLMKLSPTIHSSVSQVHSAVSPPLPPPLPASSAHHGFKQVFGYFDTDGDGKISVPELCSSLKSFFGEKMLQEDQVQAAVELWDSDGDGMLGYEDFWKLVEVEEETEKQKSLTDAFTAYEMEGKRCITPRSLRQTLQRLGEERTMEDCKLMIKRFDLNEDGVISFEEFKKMMMMR